MAEFWKFSPTFQINLKQIKKTKPTASGSQQTVGEKYSEINYRFIKGTAGKRITLRAREQMWFGF